MSITRWMVDSHGYLCGTSKTMGNYVKYEDHLAAVESLEYDIRYEREQKEELQEELRCTKAEYGDIIYRLEERITELEDEVKSI